MIYFQSKIAKQETIRKCNVLWLSPGISKVMFKCKVMDSIVNNRYFKKSVVFDKTQLQPKHCYAYFRSCESLF